jgi:hypothetical protein
LRRPSPKNHQGKIIPPPHCLTTVKLKSAPERVSQSNAFKNSSAAG